MKEMIVWIPIASVFALGMLMGCFVSALRHRRRAVGVLREDRSDPDSPYLFLELSRAGYERIRRDRYVVLKVVMENYLSAANTSAGMEDTPHNGKEK